MRGHRDLDVWKEGMALVEQIYTATSNFPDGEKYGMVTQMRRAAVSIPSNIAEGAARNTKKEFLQFLYIAQGSVVELETQLLLSERLGFASSNAIGEVEQRRDKVARLLGGLIRSIRGKLDE